MKKKFRLKSKKDIDAIFALKKNVSNNFFSVFYQKTENANFRFAMSIGRKYGNAVSRNLMKRRIRAIVNELKEELNLFDFVIVIKKEANVLAYAEIKETLTKLLNKSKIIKEG